MPDDHVNAANETPHEAVPAKAETTNRTLRLTKPFWARRFVFTVSGGDTLVVTRDGTAVPTGAAQELIDAAEKHGVTLEGN